MIIVLSEQAIASKYLNSRSCQCRVESEAGRDSSGVGLITSHVSAITRKLSVCQFILSSFMFTPHLAQVLRPLLFSLQDAARDSTCFWSS